MAPRRHPPKSAPRHREAHATPRNKDSKESHKVAKARSAKVHKRSRDGCFTCRLRRKKCSETHPRCVACTSLDIPCQYDQPDWWTNEATRDAHQGFISERIKMTRVTHKLSGMSLKPPKAQATAQRQLDSRQAQELQVPAPESFQHSSYRHTGMASDDRTASDDHTAMSAMSSYLFEDSVVDNGSDMANGFDVADGFAYDNNTRFDASEFYATLRSSGFTDEPAYIYNTNNGNITARRDATVLDQNNIFAISSLPSAEETHAGSLDSDAPSQFYAGDAEFFQGDQVWSEAFNLGQSQILLYRDVHD